MPSEDYTLREVDDMIVVTIDVDNLLGIMEVNRIGGKLNALIVAQPRKMVLDLSKVRYAGSASLGMLLSFSKALQDRGQKLILAGTHHLDTLFKVSRTVAVFEIAPDIDTAIKSMKS